MPLRTYTFPPPPRSQSVRRGWPYVMGGHGVLDVIREGLTSNLGDFEPQFHPAVY